MMTMMPAMTSDSSGLHMVPLSLELRRREQARFLSKKRYSIPEYVELLSPYVRHESLTHQQFVTEHSLDGRRILLLRHDIDHDYETALQMAEWEKRRGLRATYCVLHSAW